MPSAIEARDLAAALRRGRPTRAGVRRKVAADGYTFDSQAEYAHYCALKLLRTVGELRDLEVHKRFKLVVAGALVCAFEPDFTYVSRDGAIVVEDVKSPMTRKLPEYRIKKKLFEALYRIPVVEIVMPRRPRRRK